MEEREQEPCRICGQHRVFDRNRKPTQKESFRELIKMIVGIDVLEDDSWVPNLICRPCILKMTKQKRIKAKQQGGSLCSWNLPDFPRPPSVSPFDEFLLKAKVIAESQGFSTFRDDTTGTLTKQHPKSGDILFRIIFCSDFSWTIQYMGKYVPKNSVLADIPSAISIDVVHELLARISSAYVCPGNDDFPSVMDAMKRDVLVGKDQETIVGYKHAQCLRAVKCQILLTGNERCLACEEFRNNLRSRSSHLKRKAVTPTVKITTPFSKLNTPQKKARFGSMSKTIHSLKKQVNRQKEKIKLLLEEEAVETTIEQHEMLSSIAGSCQDEVYDLWPEDSPQRLLWNEQIKRSKLKDPRGMRWHPLMIKWCISLHCSSPKAYRQVANSGFLKLPSESTLKSYMCFTTPTPGVNVDVLSFLVKEINLENKKDYQKKVALNWDEMKIKSGIVSSVSSGKIVGFCELGDLNEELDNLSHVMSSTVQEPDMATHIIVFMVRGIMAKYELPFMWYPCRGFFSEHLWEAVWKATRVLEDLGLCVHAWVCDGASPNRKFFKIHKAADNQYKGNTYYTINRYDKTRKIYFICDVPHLLKTTRNNLENSHGHNNSKSLIFQGKSIAWPHIVSTVREDKARKLNRLPRIKEEHIHLSPQLRMRVRLAAQVLSTSMANAIDKRGNVQYSGTSHFCRQMDKWFDCLNGRFYNQDKVLRKDELEAYRKQDDWRFDWLSNDFLGWLDDWEDEGKNLQNLSKSERNALFLSYQTVEGLRITTKSFTELLPQLLAPDESLYILPVKLNQDKLELLFGKLRRSLGTNDNPTVSEASYRLLTLLVAGSTTVTPKNTNCTNFDGGTGYQLQRKYCKKQM